VVAKAVPDGYTLLAHSAGHVSNASIYSSLPYDTLKDFKGITLLASLPNVLVTSPSKGFRSAADLVKRAKDRPGELNYGSAGTGSATHMNAEVFRTVAGFSAEHVPFKGTPEALTETLTGRIDYVFAPIVAALPLVKEGRLTALAVGTATRSPLLPDVPTTVEAGFPGSEYQFWVALLAPAGVPGEILDRLHAAAIAALASPEVRLRFTALGAEPAPMEAAAFDAFLRVETARIARVVHDAGIRAQ
jgi:tripartite-type tricarboxylate transporter receptor subunit TctC